MNYEFYIKVNLPASRQAEVLEWAQRVLRKRERLDYTEVEHILDFLGSDRSPTRLRRASYEQMLKGAEKWQKSLEKRGERFREEASDVKRVLSYPASGMVWVRLVGRAAYAREGFLMSHCVASYFGKAGHYVYSLRDAENKPHCTVEFSVNGNSIQQIKGKGNGSIHPRYVRYVISFLKKKKVPVRSQELANLGYMELTGLYKRLSAKYPEFKWMTLDGRKYLYLESAK